MTNNNYIPLSHQLRPQSIDDIIGQQHLIGPGKPIRSMVENNILSSLILYGPPGTGKTSLASAIAGSIGLPFYELNASQLKKADITKVLSRKEPTVILFLDEIHRLNKANQDLLLPDTESGRLVLIGATTENPYLEVNKALRSRTQIFELKPLKKEDLEEGMKRVVQNLEKELDLTITVEEEVVESLILSSGGDLRKLINTLEMVIRSSQPESNTLHMTTEDIGDWIGGNVLTYDKSGDDHYDILSAFQKSIRGSDVDAALYYLGVLIESGDLPSIFRRLGVIAYEDVGFGNINAITRTMDAIEFSRKVGLTEARIPLAFAVIDLSLSPKSNSAYKAINKVLADIKRGRVGSVPEHLRDSHYQGASQLGRGTGYKYPHDYPGHHTYQQYLPDSLVGTTYFEPEETSRYEAFLIDQVEKYRQ